MTKRIAVLAAAGAFALSLAFAGNASAQQSPKTGRTAVSKECSAKADEQKLHGKERRKFRSSCIRDARKKKPA